MQAGTHRADRPLSGRLEASARVTVSVCTIIARNYLPAARVLARSLAEQHPDGRFAVLIIDDQYHEVADQPFEVWRTSDLDLPAVEFHRMAAIYDLMELATALKPWFLRALLARAPDTVIYLDPDIQLYSRLDEVVELAHHHGIVLTPHVIAPLPRDGLQVSETTILSSGMYNLGFIALGPGSDRFLDFWTERLRRDCYVDHANHRFVDQRWVDFVPSIFGCHILRDSRYNVAYWNLDHRDLAWDGHSYTVDGRPLGFFHFSGFHPRVPYLLSKHQGERPRILLSERPAVARLCAQYRVALLDEGFGSGPQPTYPFDVLPNGIPLNKKIRTIYREWLLEREDRHEVLPADPFSLEGADRFADYLTRPGRGSRLPLYLIREWGLRTDLQVVFPKPEDEDYEALLVWAKEEVTQGRLHPRIVEWDRRTEADGEAWADTGDLVPGICVSGYLRAELGMGEMGRLALDTVRRAQLEAGTFVYRNTMSRQDHPLTETPRFDLNVNLVAVNGDQTPAFAGDVGPSFFDGRYNIGLWAWELDAFPEKFQRGFRHFDEIWTISEFARESIASVTDKPVHTMPLPITRPAVRSDITRADMGLPEGFLFLFCFDFLSMLERKNPLGVIDAFRSAFPAGGGQKLILKSLNGNRQRVDLERLRYAMADRPDIVLVDRYFDSDEHAALMASCDCYVSLHRSEGFGLTMAEAMVLGKPVIATGYSGNLDFMDAENCYLVPWSRGEVPPGCDPYPAGTAWAEPDLAVAAQFMRRVVQQPANAAVVAARGQRSLLESHNFDVSVAFVQERMAQAQRVLEERLAEEAVAGEGELVASSGEMDAPLLANRVIAGPTACPAEASPSDGAALIPSGLGPPAPALAGVIRRVVRRALASTEQAARGSRGMGSRGSGRSTAPSNH